MKTLAEIRARLLEISGEIDGMQANAEGYTDEQVEQINTLTEEFEKLSAQATTLEKVENMKAATAAPQARKAAATTPAVPRASVGASASDKFFGFKSSGDFLMAVKVAGSTGQVHERLQNVMYEKNGEDGGFLVPSDISTEIVKKLEDKDESLLAQSRSAQLTGNSMSFPVDESQPWNSGVVAYWTAEGAPITESKPKMGAADLRLQKVAALVKCTDEMLEDVAALESWIKGSAGDAITYKVNSAILNGDGVGKPEGFLRSGFTVSVAKEVSQTADTIVAANLIKMLSRLLPMARAGAKWYINAGAIEQLYGLKDAQGNYIYLQGGSQFNQGPYGLLLGLPVVPMMAGIPALGDSGDIVLANLKYYWTATKAGGVKNAQSIHLHFDRAITAFRFILRVDGKVPFKTPVTPEFGSTPMSAFVKLDDRA